VGDKIENNEMGGACSAYGGRERRVQAFGGETRRKENHWEDPGIDGGIIWTGSSWLRIGTGGGHL